jgi:hypothetical protein
LTLDKAGQGYALTLSSGSLTPVTTAPFNVVGTGPNPTGGPPPVQTGPPPTVAASGLLFSSGKGKRKKFIGFTIQFSAALDPGRAQNAANYTITETTKRGKKVTNKPVGLQASYNASTHTVILTISGTHQFASGGKIIVNGSAPSGLTDTSGQFLNGGGAAGSNAVFTIQTKAKGLTKSS